MMLDAHGASDAERLATDILEDLAERGYDADLEIVAGPAIGRIGTGERWSIGDAVIDEVHRLEGDTNPDDEEDILAISIPTADVRGTTSVPVGANVPGHIAEALRAMATNRRT